MSILRARNRIKDKLVVKNRNRVYRKDAVEGRLIFGVEITLEQDLHWSFGRN